MSRINETLKQTIDAIDLDRRLNELTEQAEQVAKKALDSAAGYAREHRDDVDRLLTKVSTTIDERTDGKYADRLTEVRQRVERGVSRLAERSSPDDD